MLIVLPQSFNKVSPPFSYGRTLDLFDRWITLYCVLAFYLLLNIFFFSSSSCLSRSCGSYPLRHPSRSGHEGVLLWNHNNWYRSKVTWRCLRSNSIFRSSIVLSISVYGRLGWMSFLPRVSWRKHCSEGRKKPQDMKEETWQELNDKALTVIKLCLTDEVLDEFSLEKTSLL